MSQYHLSKSVHSGEGERGDRHWAAHLVFSQGRKTLRQRRVLRGAALGGVMQEVADDTWATSSGSNLEQTQQAHVSEMFSVAVN